MTSLNDTAHSLVPLSTAPSPCATDVSSAEEDDTMIVSRRVTFNSCDQVFEIPSRNSFTPDEIQAAHYSKDDFKDLKRGACETIQLERAGNLQATEDIMRGLEGRTNVGFNFVKSNRQQASFAVIDEQDRQDEMGISDSMLIAKVYQESSLPSRATAFAKGLLDAQEVIGDIAMSAAQPTPSPTDDDDSSSAPSQQQALDPNMLVCLLNTVMEDSTVETGLHLQLQNDIEEPQLDPMEWTAEAA